MIFNSKSLAIFGIISAAASANAFAPRGGSVATSSAVDMSTSEVAEPHSLLPPDEVLESYSPSIGSKLELEIALTNIKTTFEQKLQKNVNLVRVSAPMFLSKTSGFNDNLNGVERPATFAPRDFQDVKLEVPFSLAKWKRWALHYYDVPAGQGVVTDMRGLRCDDDVDFTHSLYVDQFDWEKHIAQEDRNEEYLENTVKSIYSALVETEKMVEAEYGIKAVLPEEITFISSDEALKAHPDLSPKERENLYCEKHGAVFFMGIGGNKEDGELRHDGRAPDYDDWITPRACGGTGLNGDILVWNPLLKQSFEISSMGIRVNPEVMEKQLDLCGNNDRKELIWHQMLLDGTLPQTIGGGIGQSRLCQFMLRCAHIGEVQHGWYNPEEVDFLKTKNVDLLGLGEF
uniref:Aminoacyl-transfer RNA synthetases class-II family profile domain-containing protein n=1 Tax=Chaetoceros debilis TaxID=122233 RepID=A0A7S3V6X9_9STRA|mmetsp:Transcript_23362/g.35529  ORF Transcript_23362/g.35529 Transcript_23362/m.35529 type:complete len:401 (+) Transcript_23362:112-1314(+)|eukprot:CAMPEP_0194072604 /NCGR_PEP_ID=MMETSP0149-20130528/302_1 /TAXON_ID=122233 /ORGANISM="Chaetoceros debilis, Strain MM31A-1" /LENGTH=400 /DNA_ID=CAMNT_0038752501 /DNA_START=61 /DNA_END=1263 /DNA_ORIENTATION=+